MKQWKWLDGSCNKLEIRKCEHQFWICCWLNDLEWRNGISNLPGACLLSLHKKTKELVKFHLFIPFETNNCVYLNKNVIAYVVGGIKYVWVGLNFTVAPCLINKHFYTVQQILLFYVLIHERERETSICCCPYLFMHSWLLLQCALTRDQAHNLGLSGRPSHQLNYTARPQIFK